MIDKGAKFYFLFEDKSVVEAVFRYPPQPYQGESLMNHCPISESDLHRLASESVDKWRIDSPLGQIYIGDLTKNVDFYDKKEVQYIIKKMAQSVINAKHNFIK